MSTHYLALDIGSTTVVAIVIDLDTNSVVGAASAANSSEVTSAADKRISRSEWDLDAMTELAIGKRRRARSPHQRPPSRHRRHRAATGSSTP